MDILYCDTEFNGFGGELISFALVPENTSKPEVYAVLEPTEPYVPWVAEHVVPFLYPEQIITRERAGRALASYLRLFNDPVIVADWPEDLSHMLNLLVQGPGMMVAASDFKMEYRQFKGFNTADASKVPHNALWDARALRDYAISISS